MGADGHIQIWRDDVVRAAWPDCDALFDCLPTHYADELDGVKYHHVYRGDSYATEWDDPGEWYDSSGEVDTARLQEFVDWLNARSTDWEVWT